jgi:hypothetical protein
LWDDPDLASAVTHRWFPDLCPEDAGVEVLFEWSPGRADPRWLDDRTAFDAALLVRTSEGIRLIGVETKYHEYPEREPLVRRRAGTEVTRVVKQRYRHVSAAAGLFARADAIEELWGTDVEQVWRDHLLALACQQESSAIIAVRYILVAPAQNPPWPNVAERYAALLSPAARPTFEYRTLHSMIDDAADLLAHATHFRRRYLDVGI